MRGITISLDGTRLSDLYFNFEHPNREKLYTKNYKDPINHEELSAADRLDAQEFASILGIPERHKDEFVTDLIKDFQRRL